MLRLAGLGPDIGRIVRRSVFWFHLGQPLTCLLSEPAPFPTQACVPSVTGAHGLSSPKALEPGVGPATLPSSESPVPGGSGQETWTH